MLDAYYDELEPELVAKVISDTKEVMEAIKPPTTENIELAKFFNKRPFGCKTVSIKHMAEIFVGSEIPSLPTFESVMDVGTIIAVEIDGEDFIVNEIDDDDDAYPLDGSDYFRMKDYKFIFDEDRIQSALRRCKLSRIIEVLENDEGDY